MQFHLDGFRPGDPSILPAAKTVSQHDSENLPSQVDVLIVGCGPAGLTLAAQLAAFPDIKTCIVEQLGGPLQRGRADGVACRSMEMFNAFGFADKLLKEAYWVNETTFWKPDENRPEFIVRNGRVQDVEDGLSEFPHVILNQARVHDFYLDAMRNSPTRLQPFYLKKLTSLQTDTNKVNDSASYPVAATFDSVSESNPAMVETINARYVVGCDGARSKVRECIDLTLKGDAANQAWGVMDVLMVTDFPDIRMKSLIQSANQGSIVVIPREGGYLVRLYVELARLDADERVADRKITESHLIAKANAIFHPYTLDVKEVAWWSVYEIGQRLCDRFDDVPDAQRGKRRPRVFIAGDACHTHSPKAGQGMNVSMRDAFNLGWKLVSVLQGNAMPELLDTYTGERQKVARTLIDFDREWAAIVGSKPKVGNDTVQGDSNTNSAGVSPAEFQQYFTRSGRYTAGTAIQYLPSTITGTAVHQHLASGLEIGMRFHSAPVIRLADGKPMQLGHVIKADARWRLFIFADASDPAQGATAVDRLCQYLEQDSQSPLNRYGKEGNSNRTESVAELDTELDIDSLFDVRAVYQQHFRELDLHTMPRLLLPSKGPYGLTDYEKIFCADLKDDIFSLRQIDREQGCMIIVRPDQHIAQVLPLKAYTELTTFFDNVLIQRDSAIN